MGGGSRGSSSSAPCTRVDDSRAVGVGGPDSDEESSSSQESATVGAAALAALDLCMLVLMTVLGRWTSLIDEPES